DSQEPRATSYQRMRGVEGILLHASFGCCGPVHAFHQVVRQPDLAVLSQRIRESSFIVLSEGEAVDEVDRFVVGGDFRSDVHGCGSQSTPGYSTSNADSHSNQDVLPGHQKIYARFPLGSEVGVWRSRPHPGGTSTPTVPSWWIWLGRGCARGCQPRPT